MGRDQRRLRQPGDVPKALLVEVREVDQDAELVAGAHQRPAEIGEAGAGIGRARELERHAVAEGVGPAPHQAERAQAGLIEDLERVEPGIDRLGALDVKDRGEHAALEAIPQLGDRAHHLEPPAGGALVAKQARGERPGEALGAHHARRRRKPELMVARRAARARSGGAPGRREQGEEAASEAAFLGPRQIEMAERRALKQAVGALRVAEEREQRVVVAVDDRQPLGIFCRQEKVLTRPPRGGHRRRTGARPDGRRARPARSARGGCRWRPDGRGPSPGCGRPRAPSPAGGR